MKKCDFFVTHVQHELCYWSLLEADPASSVAEERVLKYKKCFTKVKSLSRGVEGNTFISFYFLHILAADFQICQTRKLKFCHEK